MIKIKNTGYPWLGTIFDAMLKTDFDVNNQPGSDVLRVRAAVTGHQSFVVAVCHTNIEFALWDIRTQSPVLVKLEKAGKIKIVGSM